MRLSARQKRILVALSNAPHTCRYLQAWCGKQPGDAYEALRALRTAGHVIKPVGGAMWRITAKGREALGQRRLPL